MRVDRPLINNYAVEPTKIKLKEGVNQPEFQAKLENLADKREISKAEFKELAKSVEGGQASLAEFLKSNGIIPEADVQKLTTFHVGFDSRLKVRINSSHLLSYLFPQKKTGIESFSVPLQRNLEKLLTSGLAADDPKKAELTGKIKKAIKDFSENPNIQDAFNKLKIALDGFGITADQKTGALSIIQKSETNWKNAQHVLGPIKVSSQSEMSRDFSTNSLGPFIHGFGKIHESDLSEEDKAVYTKIKAILLEAQKRVTDLHISEGLIKAPTTEGEGLLFQESDITKLLSSSNSKDVEAGIAAAKALSDLSYSPDLCKLAVKNSSMAASSEASDSISSMQIQTSFIKWSRGIESKAFFQGFLPGAFQAGAAPVFKQYGVSDSGIDINKYISAVGFNRVMSGNNMLGGSLSSDIDFKLVFDDLKMKKDLMAKFPQLNEKKIDEMIDKIKDSFTKTLKDARDTYFDNPRGFRLTLEVGDFTVKKKSELIAFLITNNSTEKNFLSTVRDNNSFMSGNSDVHKDFIDLIRNGIKPPKDFDSPGFDVSAFVDSLKLDKKENKAYIDIAKKKIVQYIQAKGAAAAPEEKQLLNALTNKKLVNMLDSENVTSKIIAYLKKPENKALLKDVVTVKGLSDQELTKNIQSQYIGDSDKGSITAIKHLPEIEKILTSVIDKITADFSGLAVSTIKGYLKKEEEGKEDQPITDYLKKKGINLDSITTKQLKDLLSDNPVLLKKILHAKAPDGEELSKKIIAEPGVGTAIREFTMFSSIDDAGKKLDLAIGLAKTFTKEEGRAYIGRDGVDQNANFIFSVKYSGCRPNDVFDSTRKDVFMNIPKLSTDLVNTLTAGLEEPQKTNLKGIINTALKDFKAEFSKDPEKAMAKLKALINELNVSPELKAAAIKIFDDPSKKYDHSQIIAQAVNTFAIQIQQRTYELESSKPHEPGENVHKKIDGMYDRITRDEFVEMLGNDNLRPKLDTMVKSMISDLQKLPEDSPLRLILRDQIAKLETLSGIAGRNQTLIDYVNSSPKPAPPPPAVAEKMKQAFELFDTINTISTKMSTYLFSG